MRFHSAEASVEESGGLSQPTEHIGARRGFAVGYNAPSAGQRAVTTRRRPDAEWSRTVARADPSRQFVGTGQPPRGMS
jgi:hypothetical protein